MHARLIHAAVAEQARTRPAAPALIDGCEHLDYATLDAASDVYALELAAAASVPASWSPSCCPARPAWRLLCSPSSSAARPTPPWTGAGPRSGSPT